MRSNDAADAAADAVGDAADAAAGRCARTETCMRHDGRMTIQLVGVGLGRTGTMSLKLALEQLLGGTCHHMVEVFGQPDQVAVWDAAMRRRSGRLPDAARRLLRHRRLSGRGSVARTGAAFPDAPVLLSTRSSAQAWWDSASSTIFPSTQRPADDDDDSQPAPSDDPRDVRPQPRCTRSTTPRA